MCRDVVSVGQRFSYTVIRENPIFTETIVPYLKELSTYSKRSSSEADPFPSVCAIEPQPLGRHIVVRQFWISPPV